MNRDDYWVCRASEGRLPNKEQRDANRTDGDIPHNTPLDFEIDLLARRVLGYESFEEFVKAVGVRMDEVANGDGRGKERRIDRDQV